MPTLRPKQPEPSHFGAALLASLLAGLIVRIAAVYYLDVWHDELFSLDVARLNFPSFRAFVASGSDYHPPGFYFVLQLVRMGGADSGELAYRLFNLAWYCVLILGLWIYGRHVPQSRRPLVVAAALLAVSPSFVYHGAELRMYSMLLAASTVGLLSAHLATTTLRTRWFVVFGLASLLGALTHYSSIVISVSLGLAMLLVSGDRARVARNCLLAVLIVGLGLFPFAAIVAKHMVKEPAYAVPVWRSAIYLGMGMTAPLLLSCGVVALLRRGRPLPAGSPVEYTPLGALAFVAAALFSICILCTWGISGTNLVNAGVSLVPASWLIIAISGWLTSRNTLHLKLVLGGVLACNLVLSARLLHDPSRLSGNRLSTVTKFKRVLLVQPRWASADGTQRAIIHIDWPRDNAYFREKFAASITLEAVEFVSTGRPKHSPAAIRRLMDAGATEVLLLTRGRITAPMLDGLHDKFAIEHLRPGVAVVAPRPNPIDD